MTNHPRQHTLSCALLRIVLIACIGVGSSVSRADELGVPNPTAASLALDFYRIAVFREFQHEPPGITKWSLGPLVAVVGEPRRADVPQLTKLIDTLSQITGLRFAAATEFDSDGKSRTSEGSTAWAYGQLLEARWVTSTSVLRHTIDLRIETGSRVRAFRSTMAILFATRTSILSFPWPEHAWTIRLLANPLFNCVVSMLVDPDSRTITSALIAIPTDQPEWVIRRCINEEITQSLGLTTDVPGSRLTLFNKAMDPYWTELT